jgi:hypothetical protein
MEIETCYFCGGRKHCIKEDVGGEVSCDNVTDVCLSCAIGDRIRRFEEKEITFDELKNEISEALDDVIAKRRKKLTETI